jgi:transposase
MRRSNDLRKRVIEFCNKGGTQTAAAERFGVSRKSIYTWLSSKAPYISKAPGPKKAHKLDWEALRRYAEKNDDAFLKEIAEEFKVGTTAVWYALRKMKISRKKNHTLRRSQAL